MSTNIGATGMATVIKASATFPNGFTVDAYADDADPIDMPEIDIAATGMDVNGNLYYWNSPVPLDFTVNVNPGTEADRNLSILFEANRAAKGKTTARDNITIVQTMPDGSTVSLSDGVIVKGAPGVSVASAGRKKSKSYLFRFESIAVTAATI